jgi:lipid-A-disaccharide synthase
MSSHDILVVAGEASGDQHAAGLVTELRRRRPDLRFFGMGGAQLEAAGLERLYDAREISVMGITEVLPKLPRILAVMRGLEHAAQEREPALAILVDIPDFNLRMAQRLKSAGVRVVYYISPMLWAWRSGRLRQIARDVDRMLCILPFEESWYRERGVAARYVGSPVLDHTPPPGPAESFRRGLGLDPSRPTLALLPGSRMTEVRLLLPPMIEAAHTLSLEKPGLQIVIPVAPSIPRHAVEAPFAGRGLSPTLIHGRAPEAVGASDVAIVASGTATLEAGLMLRPMVVVYRMSPITWMVGRAMVRVPHVALVNLLSGRRVVPELLQGEVRASRIAEEARRLWSGPGREHALRGLADLRRHLGEAGAPRRAAEAVMELLGEEGAAHAAGPMVASGTGAAGSA